LIFIFLLIEPIEAKKKTEYQKDLENLQKTINNARRRIRRVSDSKAYDYLKLLPSFSVAQRSQTTMIPDSETYLSISISTNQIWAITDKAVARAKMKRLAFRKVSALEFKIKKLIKLIDEEDWTSKEFDVKGEIYESLLQKNFKLKIQLDNVLIDIKNAFEEVESVCIEVENS
jgi:hypothetical protein